MRVFISGIAGQIGSHLAERLIARGDQVWGIDNYATGRPEHLSAAEGLNLTISSVADRNVINDTIQRFKPDAIVHAAASYKDPEDFHNDALTNCVGAANLIAASKEFAVKRFIYFQTALCYGVKPLQQPIGLDHPLYPANSSYAISKTTAEQYLEISGLNYVSFRLANVIGPRNLSGPLPIFYQRLSQGKPCFVTKSRRDFVYVKDLVEVVLQAIDGTGYGAYHFSSGTDIAIKELYDQVVAAMKLEAYPEPEIRELGPDDAPSILLDPAKTIADFGTLTFTPLAITVQDAVDYYSKFGVQGGYTHLRVDAEKKAALV